VQVFDCFFRPLLGGLSFIPFFRYDDGSRLYRLSHAGCILTLFASSWLELMAATRTSMAYFVPCLIFSCWCSHFGLAGVTVLKLRALGWGRTGRVCLWAWFGWLVARGFVTVMITNAILGGTMYFFAVILLHACQGLISAVSGFVLLYESHMKQRLLPKIIDKKFAQSASRVVWFLRLGAFLTLLDAVYLPLVETYYSYPDSEHEIHLSPALFLTFDNSVVLASILILGGVIGPKDTLDQIEVMAELEHIAYIARTQGKRIAFPGKLNRHSQHCIVSFPGKYSSET
jgi:hypothetical protein